MPGPRNNRKLFCQARRQTERGGIAKMRKEAEQGGREREVDRKRESEL